MAEDRVPVWLAGAALVVYAGAFALLAVGGVQRSLAVVLVAVALLVTAAVLLQLALSRARREGLARAARLWLPLAIVVVGVGLAAYSLLGRPSGGWGLCGLCAAYLGAGQALAELRSRHGWAPWRGVVVCAGCAALFAIGITLCLAVSASWLVLAVVALAAGPIGLSLLTADVLRTGRPRLPVFTGIVLIVAGALLLRYWTGVAGPLTWAAIALLCVLIGSIGSSTQADVLLVVTVIALIWAATPHPVAADDTIGPPEGRATLVALGDSYMSGEGAREFYAGTNESGVNECRRSPTAYAHLAVATTRLRHLAFFACSGAVTFDLYSEVQWDGEPIDDTPQTGSDQLDQLRALLRRSASDVKLVIVSVGGNDAGFAEIGMACLAPGSCVARGQRWLERLTMVKARVDEAYAAIRDVVGTRVPVLAVPYPEPISPHTCGYSLLGVDEHRLLSGFVGQLDAAIHSSADDAGFYYLGGMEGALAHLRICDGPAGQMGVNFVALRSVDGFVDQVENPVNWIHNSLHPNERGHAAMARVLERWLRSHPDPPARPAPARAPTRFTSAPIQDLVSGRPISYCGGPPPDPAYCDRDDTQWSVTQVALAARDAAIPVLLIAGGWWLVWLRVLAATAPRWSRTGDRLLRRVVDSPS